MTPRTFLLPLLALSLIVPSFTYAKDISYFSVLDASTNEVLLQEKGLGSSSTYRCQLSSMSCTATASSTQLVPEALSEKIHYYLSPRNDWAVATEFKAGSAPVHTLYKVSGDSLTAQGTLPITMDITRVRYSDDGSTLLVTQVDGTVVRYETATKKTSAVSAFPSGASWITLSPNGKYAAYYIPATQSRGQRTFGVVDLVADKTYTYDEANTYWDLLTEGTTLFAFSPDSARLTYLSDRNGYPTLYEVSLSSLATAGIAGSQMITKPYSVSDFIWKDNGTLLFTANRENALSYSLYSYAPVSGALTKVADNISYDAGMLKVGQNVLFSRIQGPARIVSSYNLISGAITNFSVPGFATEANAPGQIVKAGELSGVWNQPAQATKKLVVWLHGGPYRQISPVYHSYFGYAGYDWLLDRVDEANVAVLKLDYPGSQGYGKTFAESITGNVGTGDVAKTEAAVKAFAAQHGYTDVYLLGNSYGGYLALKMLVENPGAYEGAFSINGVTDWDILTTNLRTSIFNVQFGGVPNAQNGALYDNASIIANLKNLDGQKVVVAHGNADMTVPYAQSRLFSEALEAADIDHTFLTYDGEDHVYAKEETFIDLCEEVLSFADVKGSCKI